MARILGLLCFNGLALAGLNEFSNGPVTKRQNVATATTTATVSTVTPVACASPGVNFQVNSNPAAPDSPGAVNYTVQCGSDTFGTNLYSGGQQAPNGYLDCVTVCEATTDCQAFTFVADRIDGTGTSPGNCYLKQTSCNQGVAFDRVGQNSARYFAALRPGPALGSATRTSISAAASATRSCAASATPTNSPSNATNVFFVQCDIDTEGGLLSVIGNQPDYNACFPLCDADVRCVGFTYTTFQGSNCPGYCYLKFIDPGDSGLRFTNEGLQGTNLVAALRQAQYLPSDVSSTIIATSTPGAPPAYTPPAQATTTTTITTSTSTTASVGPTSSLCPASNGTVVADSSSNAYTLYCGYEYEGESDLLPNSLNMQACIDACGARPPGGTAGGCYGVSYTGGNSGPGDCYIKTTGLYLTARPNVICAVRVVAPPAFSTTVTSTIVTSTSSSAPEPPAYSPPVDFSTTITFTTVTSTSSSAPEPPASTPPVDFSTTITTSSSSEPAPPAYTPPVQVTTTTTASSSAIESTTLSSSSSSDVAPSQPPGVITTSTSSSSEVTSTQSSSAPEPPAYTPPLEVTTTTVASFSSVETSTASLTTSSDVPPSSPAYTPPTSAPESSTLSSSIEPASTTSSTDISTSPATSSSSSTAETSSTSAPLPPAYGTTTTTSPVVSSSPTSSAIGEVTLTVTPIPASSSSGSLSSFGLPTTSSAAPPGVTDIPSCAQPCVLDLGDCAEGDVACVCSSQELLERYRSCIIQVCTPAEAQEVEYYAEGLCSSYGVTSLPPLSYPSITSTSVSTTTTPPTNTATPPSITDIPQCAQPCVLDFGGCAAGDVRCICSNQPLLENYRQCVVQSCDRAEAQNVVDYANDLCGSYGITALPPLNYPTSSSTSTTVSTSSAKPPSATDIPQCAQPCVLDFGGCAAGDVRCICSNRPLLENYRQCVVRSCNPAEAQDVVDYANDLCGSYGITALPPLNYPTSTSTSTTASTSSARVPSVTDIPQCAQPCVPSDYGNCDAGDVRCICSNQPLLEEYRTCVLQNCNAAGAQDTYNFAVELCGNYGVTSLPRLVYPSATTTATAPPTSIASRPPSVTDIPPCAQLCVRGYGGCSETDVRCICSNTPLLEEYRTCVVQSCNVADAQRYYTYASQLCGNYGVTSLPPLYPSSTTSSSLSTATPSVTTFPGVSSPSPQSCIPCTRSTGSCIKRTTVMPVYSREL